MKIILADPILGKSRHTYTANYGILYLISYLRKIHPEIEIYYLDAFMDVGTHLQKIKEIRPDLYGVSFATHTKDIVYETVRVIKEEHPFLPIICGGPHSSCAPDDVLKNSKIDVAVIGEGEITFVELVEHYFYNKGNLKDIKGIAYREGDNIVKTPFRPLIYNLDDIPFPAREKISDPSKYLGLQYRKRWPTDWIITSRGCPYNCLFCSNPVWKISKPWYRNRSPKNIGEEVKLLYDQGLKEINLRCDEFNAEISWAVEVCKEIQKLNLHDLCFTTFLRADNITDELAENLSKINCWLVYLGIESGNQKTLDGICKKITLEQVIYACKTLKKYKIKINGFFIMFNIWEEDGELKYESLEDTIKTLQFGKKLMQNDLIDLLSWSPLVIIPGAPIFDIARTHDLISSMEQITPISSIKLPDIDEKAIRKLKWNGIIVQIYSTLKNVKYVNWRQWLQFVKVFYYNLPTIRVRK
jgi:anaerobic magnesium-protoporphyrin IX monomethyl ester cyclase